MVQDRPDSAIAGTWDRRRLEHTRDSGDILKSLLREFISLGIFKYILLLVEQMFSYFLNQPSHVRRENTLGLELKDMNFSPGSAYLVLNFSGLSFLSYKVGMIPCCLPCRVFIGIKQDNK